MIAALLESARALTCATCGRNGKFLDGWRWGTDDGSLYFNAHIVQPFCSAACEVKALEKLAPRKEAAA